MTVPSPGPATAPPTRPAPAARPDDATRANPDGRAGVLARGAEFVGAVFALPVHVTYAVLWVAAFEAASADGGWRPTGGTGLRAATVLALLFYLRLVDERKDEAYDRVHNPDRPLVTGVVTAVELRRAGRLVIAVVVVANLLHAPWSAAATVAFFGYAAALTPLERRFPVLRDRPLVNIAVVYPVQLLIGVYLLVSAGAHGVRQWVLVLVFALAFLHFEFARKTRWGAAPGSRSYSATALGPVGSALVALGCAVAACGLAAGSGAPWPSVALVFPVAAASAFLGRRVTVWPKPAAMLFLIVFDAALIVAGLVG
ncbi:hypothetical protein GCM10010172_63480 [Paractinoplanes ferrugineus]|uniref:4-hydroxybenzoate polyprenyltransferase n=1 Tax=Paractinoplanes ferrugineus TaxID=113564 RepID=A0A919J9Y1_9ACTN|nr:hypothetical protein [Actinoplanes ferrugineus]GIE16460.1 hypothetical protein Afe05nite_83000 [Actinoplanes ferrugineus]